MVIICFKPLNLQGDWSNCKNVAESEQMEISAALAIFIDLSEVVNKIMKMTILQRIYFL